MYYICIAYIYYMCNIGVYPTHVLHMHTSADITILFLGRKRWEGAGEINFAIIVTKTKFNRKGGFNILLVV